MGESSVLDRIALQQLLECAGDDWAFMAELADAFYEDAPNLIQEAQQAWQAGDAGTLRRAAHSLKSNAANFGAEEMRQMCKELEDMGKAGALAGADLRLEQISAEFARVKQAVQAVILKGTLD